MKECKNPLVVYRVWVETEAGRTGFYSTRRMKRRKVGFCRCGRCEAQASYEQAQVREGLVSLSLDGLSAGQYTLDRRGDAYVLKPYVPAVLPCRGPVYRLRTSRYVDDSGTCTARSQIRRVVRGYCRCDTCASAHATNVARWRVNNNPEVLPANQHEDGLYTLWFNAREGVYRFFPWVNDPPAKSPAQVRLVREGDTS